MEDSFTKRFVKFMDGHVEEFIKSCEQGTWLSWVKDDPQQQNKIVYPLSF
jgi:hypothetical protein